MLADSELIRKCVSGDRCCQEAFYKKFAAKMYNVCIAYCNSRDDAKDVMQDGFVKVFSSLHKFNGKGSVEGWVRKIIINTAIDFYRKRLKEKNNIVIENIPDLTFEFSVLDRMNARQLIDLIQRLPESARLIFNLFVVEGYRHEEIAAKLNISIGTSKSQVSRAKSLLQSWIVRLSSSKEIAFEKI